MSPSCAELHARWRAACRPAHERFAESRERCREVQERLLRTIVEANAGTSFGRRHAFARVRSVSEFRRAVPEAGYEDFRPDVERVLRGEAGVLTAEPVERLHLTSGTERGSKLVPFTAGLRRAFQAAIQPWLYDLYARHPGLRAGKFYWVVAPAGAAVPRGGAVPVGFADDAEYLDPVGRRVLPGLSAAGAEAARARDADEFQRAAWADLLGEPSLSMISFWSPRFFSELLRRLPERAPEALRRVHERGGRARAREVERILGRSLDVRGLARRLWPGLSLVSCWTEGWAAASLPELGRFFAGAPTQGKGLLATEGVVSVPWGEGPGSVLALRSHFLEFLSETGDCLSAHELEPGALYSVLLTTQGGLYRYRLGDRVRVVGREGSAPRVEFVAREGAVADLCGEKLDEAQAERVLAKAARGLRRVPEPCFLAPRLVKGGAGYELVVGPGPRAGLERLRARVERGLGENFYYGHGRRMGQLRPLALRIVGSGRAVHPGPLSTAKPHFLKVNS